MSEMRPADAEKLDLRSQEQRQAHRRLCLSEQMGMRDNYSERRIMNGADCRASHHERFVARRERRLCNGRKPAFSGNAPFAGSENIKSAKPARASTESASLLTSAELPPAVKYLTIHKNLLFFRSCRLYCTIPLRRRSS